MSFIILHSSFLHFAKHHAVAFAFAFAVVVVVVVAVPVACAAISASVSDPVKSEVFNDYILWFK